MDTDAAELTKGDHGCETGPGCSGYSSMVHSKKVIKHALRQQAKRRRKNTTIAAGNSRTLPRIVVKPLPPPPPNDPPSPTNNVQHVNIAEEPAATMREVLASLPGFSLKSGRRRSTKKLSATAQLEAGLVDLESPASILASTSLRALLNRHTFQGLPPLYQRKLAQLLPAVDRQDAATSGLNNEFFARACLEWRKRLAEGEFTPENQQRLKMEAERDKNKLDPWKVKHFEPIWGEKREPKLRSGFHCITERSSGAVTRSSQRLRMESNLDVPISEQSHCPVTMTESKVETDDCKVVANLDNPDDLNHTELTRHESPQPEYEEMVQNLSEEANLQHCLNINSIEMAVDEQLCKDEPENDKRGIDEVQEEQEMPEIPETTEITPESCQNRIENSYEEEVQPSECEKDSKLMENHVLTMPEEETMLLVEENSSPRSTEQMEFASTESTPQLPKENESQISLDGITEMSKEHISQISENEIYQMSDCKSTTVLENSSNDKITAAEIVMDETGLMNNDRLDTNQVSHENAADTESQIPEGMEIDIETLQRIHELEVRGDMREAYEEISGCPEEIMYPILEGMEMSSNETEETESQVVQGQVENVTEQQDMNTGNEDEALRDANNYVCSEMLECSWSVDPTVNSISNNAGNNNTDETNETDNDGNNDNNNNDNRAQEEVQVPWPLVAAALDGSVAANITVTTQDECNETPTTTESTNSAQRFIGGDANMESVNCIQLPIVQGTPFQSEGLTIGAGTNCIMKNIQSQSPPIIAFPQLQSIRFVQTSFHSDQTTVPTLNNTTAISGQLQTQQNPTPQINIMRTQEEIHQINAQNTVTHNNIRNNIAQNQVQNTVAAGIAVQPQNRTQETIVVQQQTTVPTQPRQIVATIQQQQYSGATMTVSSRSSRSLNQGSQRGSRSGNKEQGGRSRSSTKEPPGAVNLERSYQICQAVIQSSPNRDQLKAHLKPPPSLLARGDNAFTTSKSGGRTVTTVKTQKPQQSQQHGKQAQAKTQAVMLRHVFATTRHAASTEASDSNTVTHLGSTTTSGLGQYILVQRTGVGDGAPRASSAPPLPPQITGMGVGVHLVRGRPASAGEGSHQAVTLKARGIDGRGAGGAEPGAPGMIMGGDPPPPCECNMRGAMVICRQCGAFCHDDCIGPQRICATCLIR